MSYMKYNGFTFRNLVIGILALVVQWSQAQVGDGPGGLPSTGLIMWYNSSNVRQSTGTVAQWNDSKVSSTYFAPSVAGSLTYNASDFTGSGDNIPFYSVPSTTALVENLIPARSNQSAYELWIVAKAYGVSSVTGLRNIRLFKISNVANTSNSTFMTATSASSAFSFQIHNNTPASIASTAATAILPNTNQLYYANIFKSGTTTVSASIANASSRYALDGVNNAGVIDFAKLTLNDPATPAAYTNYAVAEVFGFSSNTTVAQKAIITNYINQKYFSGADAYKFNYVETNSSHGLGGGVQSGILRLSTVNVNKFAVASNYQGPISYNLVTTLLSPYDGLKIRNEEWKVVANNSNDKIVFSVDKSVFASINKVKIPYLIVKSATNTVSAIYPMSFDGNKYTTTEINVPVNALINIGYLESSCTTDNTLSAAYLTWNGTGLTSFTNLASFASINIDGLTVNRLSSSTNSVGIISLAKNSATANSFSAANLAPKNPIDFLRISSKSWCVAKIGDDANIERFSITFNKSSFPPDANNYHIGYNVIVDRNGDDVLTDAEIYTTSVIAVDTYGISNLDLPNGAKIYIAQDILGFSLDDATPTAIPYKFLAHGTYDNTTTYLSATSFNHANLRGFNRWFEYTGTEIGAGVFLDKRIFKNLMGYSALLPHQVPVIIEASISGPENAKIYAFPTSTTDIYNMSLTLKQGYKYILGIIEQQNLVGYTNFRATSGLLDQNYDFPVATVNNEFKIFSTDFKKYDHLIVYDNGAANYNFGSLQTQGNISTPLTYIPYYITAKAFKIVKYNNTSSVNIGFHKSLIDPENIPDDYHHVLIIDTDGNWSTPGDRSFVGLVRSGDYYYAFDQTITAQSFALGIAKQGDNQIQQPVHEIIFSPVPTTLPISNDLLVNRLTNFPSASACKQTLKNNFVKLLVNLGEDFQFGLNKNLAPADFSVVVTVDLTYKNTAGTTLGAIETKTFTLTGKYPEALYSKVLPAGTQIVNVAVKTITPTSATPTLVDLTAIREALQMRANIVQDLAYSVPKVRTVSFVNGYIAENSDGLPVKFGWNIDECPVAGYKFQLLKLYNTDDALKSTTTFEAKAEVDWAKALTLETVKSQIELQLAEGSGYYAWRVMPYGNSFEGGVANSNNWSGWSSENTPSSPVLNLSGKTAPEGYGNYVLYHNQLENDKNFIYNRAFTEDGKTHESFAVADGLQEVLQTQSKLNSNKGVSNEQGSLVISQQIYDYSGRVVVNTLPAPILDANQAFGYRPEFIKQQGDEKIYGPWSVDVKPNTTDNLVVKEVSNNSLLGKYYSDLNPDTRVPDAEKFPFSRAVYSTDGENEVLEQGGAGKTHQPGGTRGSIKKNTAVASANELVPLFGDETPEGVVRTSVTNQNGTTSITYANRSGKTVATCLLVNDDALSPVQILPSAKVRRDANGNPEKINQDKNYDVLATKTIMDKIENQINGNVIVSTQDFDIVGEQFVKVRYTFQPTRFLLDQCENFCITCGYKTELYIYDLKKGTLAAQGYSDKNDNAQPPYNTNFADPKVEWITPGTNIPWKINSYPGNWEFTLKEWWNGGTNNSWNADVRLTGGSYRLYKVIRQNTQNDGQKVADDVQKLMDDVVEKKIIEPIKQRVALGSMKFVNKFIVDELLTNYIKSDISGNPNFGTYVELIRVDANGVETASLAYSPKTSTGSAYKHTSINSYMAIKDDMKLKIVTSCCTMFVQLYEHRPDVCSPKEYLDENELKDGTSDYHQLYSNPTYTGAMKSALGASLVAFTKRAIMDNPAAAIVGSPFDVMNGDPIEYLLRKFDSNITPSYNQIQFATMTNNMIYDNVSWKEDSLAKLTLTAAERDASKYKIFQNLRCYTIANSWKSIVQRYFAPLENEDQRNAANKPNIGSLLNEGNPGINFNGTDPNTLGPKAQIEPVQEHLSNIGFSYIGYVNSITDVKTQAYKIFNYDRDTKCESMFCAPDMNAGYTLAKLEAKTDALRGEKPLDNLEPLTTYPDITNAAIKTQLCSSYMLNATPSCMPREIEIGAGASTNLSTGSIAYKTLEVRLYSKLAEVPEVYRALSPLEYGMLKKCDEATNGVQGNVNEGSLHEDDMALAEAENSIRQVRDRLMKDCKIACEKKYELFYKEVAKMYDPDGDGQYFANPKRIVQNLEKINNGGFTQNASPAHWTLYNVSFTPSFSANLTSNPVPAIAYANNNIDVVKYPIAENLNFAPGYYVITFDVLEMNNITRFDVHTRFNNNPSTYYAYKTFDPKSLFLSNRLIVGKNQTALYFPSNGQITNLAFFAYGGQGAKLVIDNLSIKPFYNSTGAAAISASDICCTAQSLVESCKDDCMLTEQVLECSGLPTTKAQIYYRTNLDKPASWKKAGGANAPDISIPLNDADVYPELGVSTHDIHFDVLTKQYHQVYVKAVYQFSNQKKVEVIWGKNYAPENPENITVNINQATVTLATKGSTAPVFTLTDGSPNTYISANSIQSVYKYLQPGKKSLSCNASDLLPVTLSGITYFYSYEGTPKGKWEMFSLNGTSATIPMRDPAPNVILEMKVRFNYTAADGTGGTYRESCISKIDLGKVSGINLTYKPYFGINRQINTYTGINGATSTVSNITGTRLYAVRDLGSNIYNFFGGTSACDNKDMLVAQTARKITVAPGTPAQLSTVYNIMKGGFLLKPYCDPSQTTCPSLTGTGYRNTQYYAVGNGCNNGESKPQIKWQNSIPTFVQAPDNITLNSDGDFISVTQDLNISKFDKLDGTRTEVKPGVNDIEVAQPFTANDGTSLIMSNGKIYELNGTLKAVIPNYLLSPHCEFLSIDPITTDVPLGRQIIPYEDGYMYLYNSDEGICVDENSTGLKLSICRLNNQFELTNFPNEGVPVKYLLLSKSLYGQYNPSYITYDYNDHTFLVVSEVVNNYGEANGLRSHGGRDILITKYDKAFTNIVWQKLFGGNDDEILQRYFNTNSIIKTEDGYIIAAATKSTTKGQIEAANDLSGQNSITLGAKNIGYSAKMDVWLLKIDRNGNKQWDRTYGGLKDDYPIGGIIKYKEYFIIGSKSFSTNKLESINGELLDPSSDRSDKNFINFSSILQNVGNYYDNSVSGAYGDLYSYAGNSDSWIMIVDKNGEIQSDISLGGAGMDYPLALEFSPVSGYILVSNITASSNNSGNINIANMGNTSTPKYSGGDNPFKNWFVALEIPKFECNPQTVQVKWTGPIIDPPPCANPPCPPPPCTNPPCISPPPPPPTELTYLEDNLDMDFKKCKNRKAAQIVEQYNQNCIKTQQREVFSLEYSHAFHHHTLYYYDRGGNLIKTVPPAGVELLPVADLSIVGINAYKNSLAALRNTPTAHRMVTRYTYNNLGQLTEKTTPDAGKVVYLYNKVAKQRFSQTAKQAANNKFSYVKYDVLSRIVEAGEATYPAGITSLAQLNTSTYLDPVGETAFPTANRTEYNVTIYSKAVNTITAIAGPQRNLQNRVSYNYSIDNAGRRAVTYYSYDAHGNVEWVVQDIPGFSQYLIGYDYDLISGKVNKVSFNKGRIDAFYHRYEYDSENRIVAVYTSRDGELWDKDASYDYFKHGPLKRAVLGEDGVQGLDYTYTIHGWIKAINGHKEGINSDPSKDGAPGDASNPPSRVAVDEWAMMLQYYQGDFKRTDSPFIENLVPTNTIKAKDMYNGNITAWHTRTPEENRRFKTASAPEAANMPQLTGTAYTYSQVFSYDELDRIMASEAFKYSNNGNFAATDDFKTSYGYDADGNIKNLLRQGFMRADGKGKQMDQLVYKYDESVGGKPGNHKLRSVDDLATIDLARTEDIKDQADGYDNYTYDLDGNLIADAQAQKNISWTSFGKVKSVISTAANNPNFEYMYDASGNRIIKDVNNPSAGPTSSGTTTAYVRDLQGNVLATYENVRSSVYAKYNNSITQKEVHLYGSDRLGTYSSNISVATYEANSSWMPYKYEDVKMRTESKLLKWLQHIDKASGTPTKNYRYVTYSTEDFNTGTSVFMDANKTISNIPAHAGSNVFQAEDKDGNILFSGFVAKTYMGKNNVAVLFNANHMLLPNSQGLNMDPAAKSVVVQVPNGTDYLLISRGMDKKLYYHTINPSMGVISKNNEMVLSATNYGTSLAVVEDFAQNKVAVYSSKFDAVTKKQALMLLTITKPSTTITVTSQELFNIPAGVDQAEIEISASGKKLAFTTFGTIRQGFFGYYGLTESTFQIGSDYRVSDLDPALSENSGALVSPSSYQAEYDGVYEQLASQYKTLLSFVPEYNMPMLRRPDKAISIFYNAGNGLKHSKLSLHPYGHYVPDDNSATTSNIALSTDGKLLGHSHVQNIRKYSNVVTDPTYMRLVGAKTYELNDHLGNVSATVSDIVYRVFAASSTNTTVLKASTYRPEGRYAQVLSYSNYYPFGMAMVGRNFTSSTYKYGYNGKEKDENIMGSTSYDYGFRIYNPNLAKFLSVDPLTRTYPHLTPYQFASNRPIVAIDLDGLEAKDVTGEVKDPQAEKIKEIDDFMGDMASKIMLATTIMKVKTYVEVTLYSLRAANYLDETNNMAELDKKTEELAILEGRSNKKKESSVWSFGLQKSGDWDYGGGDFGGASASDDFGPPEHNKPVPQKTKVEKLREQKIDQLNREIDQLHTKLNNNAITARFLDQFTDLGMYQTFIADIIKIYRDPNRENTEGLLQDIIKEGINKLGEIVVEQSQGVK